MRACRAFTLTELLVALAVTSAIVVLMLNVFMNGSSLWQKTEEQLDTFREARAAMQMISRDFSGISAVPGVPDDFPILAMQFHPDTATEDEVNHEIYGLIPARNTGRGNLCAVGYYCVWDGARKAFVLRRQFTESNTTFENLRVALPAGGALDPAQAFNQIYARSGTGFTQDDIATYIYGFQVECADTHTLAAPNIHEWPQGTFGRELPAWVEVRFKALGSNAARKLAGQSINRQTWFPPQTTAYQRLILPSEQEFVTRIKLAR